MGTGTGTGTGTGVSPGRVLKWVPGYEYVYQRVRVPEWPGTGMGTGTYRFCALIGNRVCALNESSDTYLD